uniref:Uncharacterized protein n=1 Tax=Chenopodium quinoa TaxID=63459 RepID=A0A803L3B0_CHEQI
MSLIDAVERLGISYHFEIEIEIEELVGQIFNEFATKNFNVDYDIYNTASQFRIFRQHGYKIPCDVFNKFTSGDGKMKESLRTDIKAMVSLYEAGNLRVHGEFILDEAFAFATDALKSSASSSEQARHALKQVCILAFKGWMLFTKFFRVTSILDDTYDAYGTFEELELLTEAFERWDLTAMEKLPTDYLKEVFQLVYNTYDEFSKVTTMQGKPYAAKFAKDCGNSNHTLTSLMGMEEIREEKPFRQILQAPKAITTCEVIGRLMDDIVTREEEQARGRVASGVESYMKDYKMSREEVVQIFKKVIEDSWRELNEEILIKSNPSYGDLPKPVLQRFSTSPVCWIPSTRSSMDTLIRPKSSRKT